MKTIARKIDIKNLVRELAENKVDALELIREALSNARDHHAKCVWIRTTRDPRNQVSIMLIDNGEGMNDERLEAFWGVGATSKGNRTTIGYKGHGTKLYFDCQRLSVATRSETDANWRFSSMNSPHTEEGKEIIVSELDSKHYIHQELQRMGLLTGTGTAIFVEQVRFGDANNLLLRQKIESYCNWFTIVGDVRSGLFDTRLQFHQTIRQGGAAIEPLRPQDGELRALDVRLQINGEKDYFPLGRGPTKKDQEFLLAWQDDIREFEKETSILSYGHRFADQHAGISGAHRIQDDMTALRLTGPNDWATDDGIAIVARVEGHRRQRETYTEATWQHHSGLYSFEERFGLWLCRDFVPITQKNDLLKRALEQASKGRLQFDFSSLRNWQVFVNSQRFLPTANRNSISNLESIEPRLVDALSRVLEQALKRQGFQEWVTRLRKAKLDRRRDQETQYMESRRSEIVRWIDSKSKKDGIDPMAISGLVELDPGSSLLMKAPGSEQELFYVYGLLSARFEMPVQVLEYDTREGVDAIGLVRNPDLIQPRSIHGRVEFKFEVSAQNPIDHFFESIDVIVCWKVGRTGDIYEQTSSSDTVGRLRKRKRSVLKPPMDTHEVVYDLPDGERVIPILQISTLFGSKLPKDAR